MNDSPGDWLPLRFRDLDAYGHVYHAEFLTLLDEARSRWVASRGLPGPADFVLARLEIDWVSPLTPEDTAVRAEFVVEAVGTKSLTLDETMVAADGRVVARSRSVTVRWDRPTGSPLALSDEERRALLPQEGGR
ncbi:putative thioesterase [metagenome]|uniref:Putative thioesterase n=1 Tax=metagenome TaxID=256318 RepID=A0A2P2C032_9ZZZZ